MKTTVPALSISIKGSSLLLTVFGLALFVCFGSLVNNVEMKDEKCPQ